ncbi:hypothetical protein NIA73_00260 [Anaerobutyricum hallii]|nr:hypothetical protein [Anaerobutyricum hallii]
MARNKTSKFGAAEGLFEMEKQKVSDVQKFVKYKKYRIYKKKKSVEEVKKVQQVQDVHEEMPATQGKKRSKGEKT